MWTGDIKMLRLKDKYKKEVIPAMQEKFGYKNIMAVPKVEKVVVNTGLGREIVDKSSDEKKKIYDSVSGDLALITGQYPVLTKAKKAISAFSIREGVPIGAKVTLRGDKMYDFLERFINIALPRTRDFWGISPKAVDKNGNLTVGVKEHIVFPEIVPEKVKKIFGLEITVVTTTKTREQGIELLRLMGFPIKK